MIKGLLGFATAFFLAITGYEIWNYYVSVDHPPALLTSENALATDQLIGLGSVNIEHAVRLETAFVGTPDTAAAQSQGLLADTPFARLQTAGIDPRRDLRHLVFALYLGPDNTPGYAVAVLGSFDKGRVLAALKDEYQVSPVEDGRAGSWQVRKQDLDSCDWSRPWSLYISDTLLVAADPERLPGLLERFSARAAAQRSLERWRAFRDDQLGSLALFIPEHAPDTGNPFIQQPVSQAHDALGPFNEMYFGMGMQPLPFRARLQLMLAGEDSEAARTLASSWQSELTDSKQRWGAQMPTAARLHDALAVSDDNGALLMQAQVDKAWLEDAGNIPQELMSMMFSGSGMTSGNPGGAAAPPQERIDDNPARFLAELADNALPPYQSKPPFMPEADQVSGPFGIQLVAVEQSDQAGAGLELTVSATHSGIPNLGDGDERVQLYVESVRDAQGNELLREETCGKERNTLPAAVDKPSFENSARGEKTVRLKAGVKHADVQRILGRVELLLPVKTERVQLAALDQEHSVDRDGVRIVIQRPAVDTLDYKVYGDGRRLLAVRGLNADAKPLSATSSMSGGFLFGEGRSKSQSFAGQVASAELVLARSNVEKRFPFELTNIRPRINQSESKHDPVSVPVYSLAQLRSEFSAAPAAPADASDIKAETVAGPFRISLDRLRSFMSLRAGFSVYAPPVPGLTDNLSALALEVTDIENAAGEALVEGEPQRNALSLSEDWQDKSRLQGRTELSFETRVDETEVRKLKGNLHLHLPQKVQSVFIDNLDVGTQVGETDVITLRRIDDKGLTLDFGTRQPPLVAVNVYNAQGDSLWVPHPQLENRDGRWLGRFDIHGSASRVELLLAEVLESQVYPFELSP